MYSYVIRMLFVCIRMSFVCHSNVLICHWYILVCHPYVTRMYSYVIHMSLVCTRMSSVCHSYVLVCHPYVTRMWFYHEPLFQLIISTTLIFSMKWRRNKKIIYWYLTLCIGNLFYICFLFLKSLLRFRMHTFFHMQTLYTLILIWKSVWRRISLISYRPNKPIWVK